MAKRKRRKEARSAIDELLALRMAQAAGTATTYVPPESLAAAETAAGLWERAMAAGESDVLSAAELAIIGRALVTRGESVWFVTDGRPWPAAEWDITSRGVRPADWQYRLTLAGPSGQAVRTADAGAVLHFRMRVDARWPWRGRSPWAVASATVAIAGALERSLRDEEGGPVGHVLPVPDVEKAQAVADAMAGLRGRVVLGQTMSQGWDTGQARAPGGREWQPVRIGPAPPDEQRALRSDLADAILAAAGVPVELLSPRASSDAREAWRRFLFATIAPAGVLVANEARRVLGGAGRLDWAALAASDLQGRARAYRQLRQADMPDADARRICGFDA